MNSRVVSTKQILHRVSDGRRTAAWIEGQPSIKISFLDVPNSHMRTEELKDFIDMMNELLKIIDDKHP